MPSRSSLMINRFEVSGLSFSFGGNLIFTFYGLVGGDLRQLKKVGFGFC